MARLSNIEKLARDICWAGWVGDYRPECGKAAYWRDMKPEARAKYIEEAKWLVWIVKTLKPIRILTMVDFK